MIKQLFFAITLISISLNTRSQNLVFSYKSGHQTTSFPTSSVSSDFGKRNRPANSTMTTWHRGVDFTGTLGDPLLAIEAGIVTHIEGTGFKYIKIQGTNNFAYGHIFESADADAITLEDFVMVKIPNTTDRYAIIDLTSPICTAIGENNSDVFVYLGAEYHTSNVITQGQQIAPLGTSSDGNPFNPHVHLYSLRSADGSLSYGNTLNPLKAVVHSQPVYTVSFEPESTYQLTPDASSVFFDGSKKSSIGVRVAMNNSGQFGAKPDIKYSNVVMDIEKVELFIKKQADGNSLYNLIQGVNMESRIQYGGLNNTNIYPDYMSMDVTPFADNTKSGIMPHAYYDGNYDVFYFSDIFTRIKSFEQPPRKEDSFARNNEEAKYQDGRYSLYSKVTTISNIEHSNINAPLNIKIDNFRPYVKRVEIFQNNSNGDPENLLFDGEWELNENNKLKWNQNTSSNFDVGQNYTVYVYASEEMSDCKVKIGTNSFSNMELIDASKYKYKRVILSSEYSGNFDLTIDGHDLNVNPIESYTNLDTEYDVKIRTGSPANFLPAPSPGPVSFHIVMGCNVPLKSTVTSSCLLSNFSYSQIEDGINDGRKSIQFVNNSIGATTWKWEFGCFDQTSNLMCDHGKEDERTLTFRYLPGTYKVILTVGDGLGNSNTTFRTIQVSGDNNISIPNFSQTTSSQNSLTIYFIDQSTLPENIVSWHWNFGDDITSPMQNPIHTYEYAGNYDVLLEITDNNSNIKQIQRTIHVENNPGITVDFYLGYDPENYNAKPNTEVSFISNVTNSSGVCQYFWDFGDGSGGSNNPQPVHTYSIEGTYTVILEVIDNGGSHIQQHVINVSAIGDLNSSFTVTTSDKTASFSISGMDRGFNAYVLFGDGSSSEPFGVVPGISKFIEHTYRYASSYTAKLIVWYDGKWEDGPNVAVNIQGSQGEPIIMINLTDSYPINKPIIEAVIAYASTMEEWTPNYGTILIGSPYYNSNQKEDYYFKFIWRAVSGSQQIDDNFFLNGNEPYQYLNINYPAVQSCFAQNKPFKFTLYLDVLDANGITYQTNREVILYPPIKIELSNSYQACENTQVPFIPKVTGGMPPYIYEWSGNGSTTFDPTRIITVSNQSQTYTLKIGDGRSAMSGCYEYGKKSFTVQPSSVNVDAGDPINVCDVRTLNPAITGGAGSYTYSWYPSNYLNSEIISNPTVSSSGIGSQVYTLTATDKYGCSSSDQLIVNFYGVPQIEPLDNFIVDCGQSKTIAPHVYGGSGNYSYSWSNGATSQNIVINQISPLNLTITATDNFTGCTTQATANILTLCNTINAKNNFYLGKRAYTIPIPINSSPGCISYIAHTDCPWITLKNGVTGKNDDELVFSTTLNSTFLSRTGKIILESPGAMNSPFEITVTQTNEDLPLQVPSAYTRIQDAINDAVTGDRIEVDEGFYDEHLNFSGNKNISVKATGCPGSTKIYQYDNSNAIVSFSGGNSSILQGFTILGNENNSHNLSGSGGGINVFNSSPELIDMIVTENSSLMGAGIYLHNSNVKIINTKIISNHTEGAGWGAGICIAGGSTFLQNVLISENNAGGGGEMEGVLDGSGGGLHIYGGQLILENVTISNNYFFNGTNSSGGISLWGGVNTTINNSIITDRIGSYQNNSILFNYSDISESITGPVSITWGTNNIFTNPILDLDYHLAMGSPCINAGDLIKLDKDGSRNDMGYTGGKGIYVNNISICSKNNIFDPIPGYLQIPGNCLLSYLSGENEDFIAFHQINLKDGFSALTGSTVSFKIQENYNEPFLHDDLCDELKSSQRGSDSLWNNEKNKELYFVIYPNPTNNKTKVQIFNNHITGSYIEISNTYGSLLKKFSTNETLIDLDLSEFLAGVYLIRVTNGSQFKTGKIVKQK